MVALEILATRKYLVVSMDGNAEHAAKKCCDSLIDTLADAMRNRLTNLRDSGDQEWHRTKSNRDILQLVTNVLSETVMFAHMDRGIMLSLVDSLLFIIVETKLYGSALLSSFQALEALVDLLKKETSEESVEQKIVPDLIPTLSSSVYAKQLDVKMALCHVLRKFRNPALQMVSYVVNDAFAINASRLGEADLDTRSQAFATFIAILKRTIDSTPDKNWHRPIIIRNTDLASSRSVK